MRGSILSLCALLVVPAATAQTHLIFGTEEFPELPDGAGDVNAAPPPAYNAPTDFVDFTAGWFEYVNLTDRIVFTMRVASTERLDEAQPGYRVGCAFSGEITGGNDPLRLAFVWWQTETRSELIHWVLANDPNPNTPTVEVLHEFEAEISTPGYFRFSVLRINLTSLGERFENPSGVCDVYIPTGTGPHNSAGLAIADDSASSNASYSFRELRQTRTSAGERLDPIEKFERENATASPTTTSVSQDDSTPFVGVAAGLVIVAAIAALRQRRR